MADTTAVVVKPRGTSWPSVVGGWIAAVGMTALLAPLAVGFVASRGGAPNDVSLAVPAVLAVLIAYLVGGYVSGRMAGYATSWHGLMTAFFGLFVVLAAILVGVAADRGYLGDLRIGALDRTYGWGFGPTTVGDALTFGAILGFLATIFAGWLGGLVAPSHLGFARPVPVRAPAGAPTPTPAVPQSPFRFLPQAGRKAEERVDERRSDEPER